MVQLPLVATVTPINGAEQLDTVGVPTFTVIGPVVLVFDGEVGSVPVAVETVQVALTPLTVTARLPDNEAVNGAPAGLISVPPPAARAGPATQATAMTPAVAARVFEMLLLLRMSTCDSLSDRADRVRSGCQAIGGEARVFRIPDNSTATDGGGKLGS